MEPSHKKPMLNEYFLNQGNIMQEEEPAHKKRMYVPPPITLNHPLRLEPLRMANRRENIRRLLNSGDVTMSRPPTDTELRRAFYTYTQMYPDNDITPYDFNNIISSSIGGKIRRRKKHVYSYKKHSINKKRSTNKKRAKSMKRNR